MTAHRRLGPEDQNAVLATLSTLLIHSLPGDWSQLFLDFRAVGSFVETPVSVLNVFGQSVDWRLPDRALPFLLELRAGMYREAQGTWTAVRFHLAHPNIYFASYDWHGEPAWTHRPAPRYFTEELQMFPRSDENISGWLRQRAGLPVDTAAPPTPPTVALFEAPVFDGQGPQGPLFDRRPAVHPQDRDEILAYLEQAPLVLAARSAGRDGLEPGAELAVPLNFHTDGTWVWAGAVAYYLRRRGVPPVPQLIKHIRDRDYQIPPVDEAALTAATAVATGKARPRQLPDYAPRIISEADQQALVHLKSRLDKFGVAPHEYGIIEPKLDALVLEPAPDKDGWQVQFWDGSRGPRGRPTVFATAAGAGRVLLAELLWADHQDAARERYRAAQRAPAVAAPAPDIQPSPDDPPLSLLRDRVPIELTVGSEIDRLGPDSGNLVYAARTPYGSRSLPPDWLARRYRIYRVEQPIRAIKGTAVPWFGQAGGGTGYFLSRSVGELVADGSLAEVVDAGLLPDA